MNSKEKLEKIKDTISIEQIYQLLEAFDAAPQLQSNMIISRTICHNGHSHKLYYYENTKLFKCFTDCPEESFDIFSLIMKIQHVDLPQAINFIINYFELFEFNQNFSQNDIQFKDWDILNRYLNNSSQQLRENKKTEFNFYNDKILSFLPHPHILDWENEGITNDVIQYHNICYNPSSQGIVIPHYNDEGKLIGIRERTLIKENEIYGKYRPMLLNKQLYNHPLGFNLYNLNNSKNNIKALRLCDNL